MTNCNFPTVGTDHVWIRDLVKTHSRMSRSKVILSKGFGWSSSTAMIVLVTQRLFQGHSELMGPQQFDCSRNVVYSRISYLVARRPVQPKSSKIQALSTYRLTSKRGMVNTLHLQLLKNGTTILDGV